MPLGLKTSTHSHSLDSCVSFASTIRPFLNYYTFLGDAICMVECSFLQLDQCLSWERENFGVCSMNDLLIPWGNSWSLKLCAHGYTDLNWTPWVQESVFDSVSRYSRNRTLNFIMSYNNSCVTLLFVLPSPCFIIELTKSLRT